MMRPRLALLLLMAVSTVVSACSGGGEPSGPVVTVPADSSARVGASGGIVTVGLANGGSATLTIPAQAITGDTVIRVTALTPGAGERARLRVEPVGLLLRSPATIAITLPGAPGADAAIMLRGAGVNVTLATTVRGRTLTAASRLLGLSIPSTPLPLLRVMNRSAAVAGDDGEIIVTAVAVERRVRQLDSLIARVNNEPVAVAAIWVNLQLASIAESGDLAGRFLTNARTLICQQYFDRLRDFNQDEMDQPGDFTQGVQRVYTWLLAMQAAEFDDDCPQGLVKPEPIIAAKSVEFLAYLQRRAGSIDFEREFDEFYKSELALQVGFAQALQLLGLDGANDISDRVFALSAQTFNRLRPAAFQICARTGLQRSPALLIRVARFINAEASGNLLRDMQYCATALEYDVERGDSLEASGPLGRNPGNFDRPFVADTHRVSYGGRFDLRGDMRALRCGDGTFSGDSLVLMVGTRRLRVLPQDASGQLVPAGGVQIMTDSIAVAGGLKVAEAGAVVLRFERLGSGCLDSDTTAASPRDSLPVLVVGLREELIASLRLDFVEGLRITTGEALPDAAIGRPYSTRLAATGATGEVRWRLAERTLPPGLSLSSDGVISGTPTGTADLFSPRIEASSDGVTADKNFTLRTIIPPLRILTDSLPGGTEGVPYTLTMRAEGGTGPFVWRNPNGTLPAGLSIDSTTGVISGTPTVAITRGVSIQVRSGSDSVFRSYLHVIRPALRITTTSLPAATIGTAYSHQLLATAAGGTNSWRISAGGLPAGLTLSGTGRITGTPSGAAGTQNFTVEVSNGTVSATRELAITVSGGLFTLRVNLDANPVSSGAYVASVTSVPSGIAREITRGPCTYDSARDLFGFVCEVIAPRGSTVTLTAVVPAGVPFSWLGFPDCRATCTFTLGGADPRITAGNVTLLLNRFP